MQTFRTSIRTLILAALVTGCLPACRGEFQSNNGSGGPNDASVSPKSEVGYDAGPNDAALDNGVPTDTGSGDLANDGGSINNAVPDVSQPDVSEPPVDLGSCGGAGFGEAFDVVGVAGTTASGRIFAAPMTGGGAILGWTGGGSVHVTHVDAAGNNLADFPVAGAEIFGLAAHDAGRAVLVSRSPDILALVILDPNGGVVSDQVVIGDVPHDVTENEWFGPLIRHGRLIWTGSDWAAYYPVQRLWNDGIAHYGDQLRVYAADGASYQTVWSWGCSHSMDLRLAHNGDRLGAVCSSDCYPSKGVHFNHRGGELWPDNSGSNCAGGFGTSVGASVAFPGGFWVAFTARDQRNSADVAIVRVDGTNPKTPVWLTADDTDDTALNAVTFEDDLLVAWDGTAGNQFVLADRASGAVIEGPVNVAAAQLGGSSDFFEFANGDVGWAQRAADGSLGLARLRACR